MASKRRSEYRTSRNNILAIIGIVLTVALIAAGLWWDNQRTANALGSLGSAGPSTPAPTDDPEALQFAPIDDVLPKLTDQSQPVSVLVIGDSTGNDSDEWVNITVRHLASRHGRAVTQRIWDTQADNFRESNTPGAGETVTITNFSAPGANPTYQFQRLDSVADLEPDLVIFNHGHNSTTIESHLNAIADKLLETWSTAPAAAVIDQNPRTDDVPQSIAAGEGVRAFAAARPEVLLIDVRSAFEEAGVDGLLRDPVHPNPAGSQLWAETVWSALRIS